MYKKIEKKINFLLDKMLLSLASSDETLCFTNYGYEIGLLLKQNNDLLTIEMQEKILQILSIEKSSTLIKLIQDKKYEHLAPKIAKLLDLNEPFFSHDVIETLYKMKTYEFSEKIHPFLSLSIDDNMLNSELTYKTGHKYFIKFGYTDKTSFKFLNDSAKKYIKRAEKIKSNFPNY